jgi:hypothetical protein
LSGTRPPERSLPSAPVQLDRQSIERRDFPIGRRGYEPAAVDAHLHAVAAELEELEGYLSARDSESLGSAAAGQVQSILEAAEVTAANIERQAAEHAAHAREQADRDAERTRSGARAHVLAVSRATTALLEKVESMDHEVGALIQSLRTGAGRLASDLRGLEANMEELYDAAAGVDIDPIADSGAIDEGEAMAGEEVLAEGEAMDDSGATADLPALDVDMDRLPPDEPLERPSPALGAINGAYEQPPPAPLPPSAAPGPGSSAPGATPAREADPDGARLIALNMALNGEPREQADRYLAENFELADRAKLLDEVYAAIES